MGASLGVGLGVVGFLVCGGGGGGWFLVSVVKPKTDWAMCWPRGCCRGGGGRKFRPRSLALVCGGDGGGFFINITKKVVSKTEGANY